MVKQLKLEVAHGGRGGHFLNMIKSCLSFISCAFYIVLGKIVLFGSLKEFLKKLIFFLVSFLDFFKTALVQNGVFYAVRIANLIFLF